MYNIPANQPNTSTGGSVDVSYKQDKVDVNLQTTSKSVVGAINEINADYVRPAQLDAVREIAQGKSKGYVFDTYTDLTDAIASDTDFVAALKIGDVFLIRDNDSSNYWWDGSTPQVLNDQEIDIDYISTDEINALF